VVVVDHLHLGKDLATSKLVDFVREGVSSRVGLQSQLQLGHRFLLDGDLQRHVRNGDGVVEPALHLNQSVVTGVTPDKLLDFVDSSDNVLDGAEDALSPHHVAYGEDNWLLILQFFLDLLAVLLVLSVELLDYVFRCILPPLPSPHFIFE
jgi:hypothetical protein